MKNLHILPTDKPSRFSLNSSGKYHLTNQLYTNSPNFTNQSIYITSDKEIKVGDWTLMFDGLGNLFLCDKPQQYLGIEKGHHLNKGLRKIILTTDQDLIKDGVQAIDDDFLEWFIKNPSCEWVETERLEDGQYVDRFADGSVVEGIYENYKIIIPKEEPKEETQGYICPQTQLQCKDECCVSAEDCHIEAGFGIISDCEPPKEETLEEVAKRIWSDATSQLTSQNSFIQGAKWQAEKMYSEEDMKQFAFECVANFLSNNDNKVEMELVEVIIDRNNKKFEQFKKK